MIYSSRQTLASHFGGSRNLFCLVIINSKRMSLSISTNNILQFFILRDRLSWGAFYSIPQTVLKRTELQPSTIINISGPTFKDFVVVLSLHPMTSKINCLCTRLSQINKFQIPVSGTVSRWGIKERKIKGDNLYKVFSSVNAL